MMINIFHSQSFSRPSTITQSMKERRLAFLLGEDQITIDARNNQSTHITPQKSLLRCMSASGVNKKIQNKIRNESKERPTNVLTKRTTTDHCSSKISSSSSTSMYDSAEIVANVLGKSRIHNIQASTTKSNSSFCLRRQSSEVGSGLNSSYDIILPQVATKSRETCNQNAAVKR